jgi:hypothetical protein
MYYIVVSTRTEVQTFYTTRDDRGRGIRNSKGIFNDRR